MFSSLDRPVQLRLLGEFKLVVDGTDKTASISYGKAKLLLAMLALADKPSARAALAEVLWPSCVVDARANLRHAICMLRHVLAPFDRALVSSGRMLSLDSDLVFVDVLALAGVGTYAGLDVTQRLSHDNGELLDRLVSSENTALSAWKINWQSRLAQEVSQCRQKHIGDLCARGARQQAMASARQWVQLHPGDEHAHRSLIRLLNEACNRDAAVRAYEHCAAVMGEYYGAEPSAETRALLEGPLHASQESPEGQDGARSDFRPLAVLAVAMTHKGEGIPAEHILERLQKTRASLARLAVGRGSRLEEGPDGSLAIMFGYPEVCERPAEAAARLACDIRRFAMLPGVSLGMGMHAELASVNAGNASVATMLIGQRALRLAYLAANGETLMTEGAQHRLGERFLVQADERYGLRVGLLLRQAESLAVHRMFGRASEFDVLVQRWGSIEPGAKPHTVLVHGELGVGKSLLLHVFAEYVRRGRGAVKLLRCSQQSMHLPLHPLREYFLQRLARSGEVPSVALADIGEHYAHSMESLGYRAGLDRASSARLTRYFMEFPYQTFCGGPGGHALPEALIAPLRSILTHRKLPGQPLLIVLDDAQWADEGMLALLQALALQPTNEATMVLVSSRNENFRARLTETIAMRPLGKTAMSEMVNYRARNKQLPPKVRKRIVEKSGGIPLYAEEMVRHGPGELETGPTPLIRDLRAARAGCRAGGTAFPELPRTSSEHNGGAAGPCRTWQYGGSHGSG
jgi:DNA-binding SARP family transcriptional activator